MRKYIGTKEVKAMPMNLGEYIKTSGRNPYMNDGKMHGEDEPGYLVEYKDGYQSWSPAQAFEEAYKCSETFLDRLAIELDELCDKQDKLYKFFKTDTYKQLSDTEKILLNAQLVEMLAYSRILTLRIKYSKPVLSPDYCNIGTQPGTTEVPECGCNCCDCECDTTSEASE